MKMNIMRIEGAFRLLEDIRVAAKLILVVQRRLLTANVERFQSPQKFFVSRRIQSLHVI